MYVHGCVRAYVHAHIHRLYINKYSGNIFCFLTVDLRPESGQSSGANQRQTRVGSRSWSHSFGNCQGESLSMKTTLAALFGGMEFMFRKILSILIL